MHGLKTDSKSFKISIDLNTNQNHTSKDFYSDKIEITPKDIPDLKEKILKDDTIDFVSEIRMWYLIEPKQGIAKQFTAACIDDRTIEIPLLKTNSIPLNQSIIFL